METLSRIKDEYIRKAGAVIGGVIEAELFSDPRMKEANPEEVRSAIADLLKYSSGELNNLSISQLEKFKIQLLENDIKDNVEQAKMAMAFAAVTQQLSKDAKKMFTGAFRDILVEKLDKLTIEYNKKVDDFLYLAGDAFAKKEALQKYGLEAHSKINSWWLLIAAFLASIFLKLKSK